MKNLEQKIYFGLTLFFLIGLSVFVWHTGTRLFFGTTDSSYHLNVAQGFLRAGGLTVKDFWDSLPMGRPQNYPPLFHLLLSDLLRFGFIPEVALKIMIELSVVGGLLVYYVGLSKVFNSKAAFWSTLFLGLSVQFIRVSATVMPAAIVISLVPLMFCAITQRKWLSYIIILTLMLYLHLFLPFIILICLAFYIILFDRTVFVTALKSSLIALVLYSPWGIHILFGGIDYIKYFNSNYEISRYQAAPITSLLILSLGLFAIFYLFLRKLFSKEAYFFLIIALLFLLMSFLSTARMLNGHLLASLAIFIGLFAYEITSKYKYSTIFFCLIAIAGLFVMPNIGFDKKLSVDFNQPTLARTLYLTSKQPTEEKYQNLFSDIMINSKEGESLGTAIENFDSIEIDRKAYQSNISILLAANSGRPTINLYQPEYYFRELPDLSKARLVLLNRSIENLTSDYFLQFGHSQSESEKITRSIQSGFSMISSYNSGDENSIVYLYKKKSAAVYQESLPKTVFPLWLANGVLIILIGLLIADLAKNNNPKKARLA